MALKVIIPPGLTEVTVNGLHQWDYGREIEIHADNLPAVVEVHFACAGMETAVVRNCAAIDGVVTAAVPDICLEQTTPIVAWVYDAGGTSGKTILTIKLPVTQRTKPQPRESIPEKTSDKYTDAIAAMNEVVGKLKNGQISVKKADEALEAGHALEADSAKVTTPTALIEENKSVTSYKIESTGIYAVRFEIFEGEAFSLIAIPDLDVGTYYGTRISNCIPYRGSPAVDAGALFTTTDDLLVVWGGQNLPILGLYKIAGI